MQVEVRNLTKTFGPLRANDNISLNFAAGQIHGVLGENGAGKSTLMKMLSGFQRRTSGEILLDGKPAMVDNPGAALASGIGMVYQEPLDVPAFTALENFFCASPRSALPNFAAARRVLLDLAHRLNFSTPPDAPISSLTIGQRQQLEIMRLLACGARVLILDEPTTGITAAQKIALFAALRTLASEGNTVLFVSHKLDEVADLCTTVSVLRAGQVVGEGPMAMPQSQERLLGLMFGELPSKAATNDQRSTTDQTFAALPPVWRLEQLSAREGALMLRDLTLDIPAGSVFGLAGLEGSGQQLLLHVLSGHTRPLAGRLHLAGKHVTNAPPDVFRRAGVQHLPADRLAEGMVGDFTLAEHIALQNQHGLLNQQTALAAARTAITDYAIKATPASTIASLSGGNQQRAMLALLPERCAGILLEQPTRGLDISSARAIWGRLLARRTQGTAIVFATADLDEILERSDYVLVFFAGRVSAPLPRATLSAARLAELIGGVGFEDMHG